MTLSDGDLPPVVAHRRELDLDAPSHHKPKAKPWEHPEDSRSIRLEQLAEDIRIHVDALAVLRDEYARVLLWRPEPEPRSPVDGRQFGADDAGTAEEWRERSA